MINLEFFYASCVHHHYAVAICIERCENNMKIKYFNFSLPPVSLATLWSSEKNRCNAAGGDGDEEDDEGVVCYCPYGYELTEDETGCQDVNECEVYGSSSEDLDDEDGSKDPDSRNHHPRVTFCSHSCTNLIGKLNGAFLFECTLLMFIICFIYVHSSHPFVIPTSHYAMLCVCDCLLYLPQ